jgi:hypothetical protein
VTNDQVRNDPNGIVNRIAAAHQEPVAEKSRVLLTEGGSVTSRGEGAAFVVVPSLQDEGTGGAERLRGVRRQAFGPDLHLRLPMQLAYDVAKTRRRAHALRIRRYAPATKRAG